MTASFSKRKAVRSLIGQILFRKNPKKWIYLSAKTGCLNQRQRSERRPGGLWIASTGWSLLALRVGPRACVQGGMCGLPCVPASVLYHEVSTPAWAQEGLAIQEDIERLKAGTGRGPQTDTAGRGAQEASDGPSAHATVALLLCSRCWGSGLARLSAVVGAVGQSAGDGGRRSTGGASGPGLGRVGPSLGITALERRARQDSRQRGRGLPPVPGTHHPPALRACTMARATATDGQSRR